MGKKKHPAAVTLGRRGGRVKSAAKAEAARRNGRKGGRPATFPVFDKRGRLIRVTVPDD